MATDHDSPPVLAEARETATIIEEELSRLPPRYRAPLILACLHGLPKPDIVTRLGLPTITVTGRLARGKALLRSRLTKRGLTPALVASALSGAASIHAWPVALTAVTIAAAATLRRGQTASLAPQPLALMKGVLTMTTIHRLVWTSLILLTTFALSLGVLWMLPTATAEQQPAPQPEYTDPELARDYAALQGRWIERASFTQNYAWAKVTALPSWIVIDGAKESRHGLYFEGNLESTFRLEKSPTGKVMIQSYRYRTPDKREVESTDRVLYSLEGDVLIRTVGPREQLPKKLGEAGNAQAMTTIYQRLAAGDIQAMIKRLGGENRIQAARQLRDLAIAMHKYHVDFHRLPQAAAFDPKTGQPLLSWRVLILPYLGQDHLFKEFKLDEPWDGPHNKALLSKMPPIYAHPDVDKDATTGLTHYQVFTSPARQQPGRSYKFAPIFSLDPKFTLSLQQLTIADGTSNTILIAEARQAVPWTKPDDLLIEHDDAPLPLLGAVPTGNDFFAVFGDGSVNILLRTHPDTKLYRQIIGYNDAMNYDASAIFK